MQLVPKWFRKLVQPHTLAEVAAFEMQHQQQIALQAEHAISTHRYIKHMAQGTIKSINEWNELEEARHAQSTNEL